MVKRLMCFVDESGQDARSESFVVAVIASKSDLDVLRLQVLQLEKASGVGARKWHKTRSERRIDFMEKAMEKQLVKGEVFYGQFQKPLPYFLPMLESIEFAIVASAENSRAVVTVDGIDRKKARELTNALRVRRLSVDLVRSARDESEPMLRLADRWVGCIRAGLEDPQSQEAKIVKKAIAGEYLKKL